MVMANRLGDETSGQLVYRITGKRLMGLRRSAVSSPSAQSLRVSGGELACVLYRIYLQMFANENQMKWVSLIPDARNIKNVSLQQYCRSSFVALLRKGKESGRRWLGCNDGPSLESR